MSEILKRQRLSERIADNLRHYPIVAVLGARQVGKTHIARTFATSESHRFDLEDTATAAALSENPNSILGALKGVVVIDEVQELPKLFPTLRVLADREDAPAKFVISGSVSPNMIRGIGESLAGRVATLEIGGFDLTEAGVKNWQQLWLRGTHPPSFLADTDSDSMDWRSNYLNALIGRDLRIWSESKLKPTGTRKLLTLLADSTGRTWNHSSAAQVLGIDPKTIQDHVEVLEGAYLLRILPPLSVNIRKRLRKSPTIHLRDTGIAHALIGIANLNRLHTHPASGHTWESFCVDQIIRLTETRPEHCFTYSEQSGREIDLVLERPNGRFGFEIKSADAAMPSQAHRQLVKDLKLDALHVIRKGNQTLNTGSGTFSTGITSLPEVCGSIR
jgi:predicted AAA+ superfamily ATPase